MLRGIIIAGDVYIIMLAFRNNKSSGNDRIEHLNIFKGKDRLGSLKMRNSAEIFHDATSRN